ncbi:DUF1510 family protein [Lentibacillus lipolyticus]|nr:DUF1510 family protein [Lentibacillus lipolyticus]
MSDYDHLSRVNKYEKRRKNTKSLSMFIVLGSILLIALVLLLIFGGGGNTASDETEQSDHADNTQVSGDSETSGMDKLDNEEASHDDSGADNKGNEEAAEMDGDSGKDITTEKAEPSDDNVLEAYTGNWEPVGTEQPEPHTVNFNEDSQDRKEMRQAVAAATDLNVNDFIMWYISRNGEQKVLATVSSKDESEVYRVYMSWISNEGWKPTKVERLKENDQKWRYE